MAMLELTFPGGHRTKSKVMGYEIVTDYPPRLGGEGSAPSPWLTFLAALASCQGIHIRNYCAKHSLPYEDIKVTLDPIVSPNDPDYFPEFNLEVLTPEGFSEEHKKGIYEAAQSCKVVKHLCVHEVKVNMVVK